MPLLQGKFDPTRFNATTLAIETYTVQADFLGREDPTAKIPLWTDLSYPEKMKHVDQAQLVIERLEFAGVIS
jgi:hypothetical protein